MLVNDGRVAAHHETGLADRALRQRADTSTLWHYGSITKTLTAVAVMQLRDRGRLSLDDRVATFIPELRQMHDPFGMMDSITVRMLLSHSGGFRGGTWPWGEGRAWEPFEPTRWEQLAAMMPWQRLEFRPGSRYGYSNPAYVYLARIVEQLTGDPWAVYVQKNVFLPLGMTRSYVGSTPYVLAAHRASGYTRVRDTTAAGGERLATAGRDFDPGVTIPNSGWNAPLADLARWAAFLAGAAPGDTASARRYETVLARRTLDEMWRPRFPVPEGVQPAGHVGLGFFLFQDTVVGHGGEQTGFRAMLQVNPRSRRALVWVVNTVDEVRYEEARARWHGLLAAAAPLLR